MKVRGWKATLATAAVLFGLAIVSASATEQSATIHGYVLDSACAFTKGLKKPISEECAVSCAKAGSPLVILSDTGTIYWPISDTMPAEGQNGKLMEFAGKKVSVTGKVFTRGGSRAVVIQDIKASPASK